MKTHIRRINRKGPGPQFSTPCGANVPWVTGTTSDPSKVDCLRCLSYLKKQGAEGITLQDIAETEPPKFPEP